jgi:hypothetical protein
VALQTWFTRLSLTIPHFGERGSMCRSVQSGAHAICILQMPRERSLNAQIGDARFLSRAIAMIYSRYYGGYCIIMQSPHKHASFRPRPSW